MMKLTLAATCRCLALAPLTVLLFLAAAIPVRSQTLVVVSGGQTRAQGDTVSINTIPNMPNLVLSVSGGSSCDTFSYQIDVSYTDQAQFLTEVSYGASNVEGDQSSTVYWGGVLQGGNATITWTFNGVQEASFGFLINGINPANSAVDAYLASGNAPWFAQNLVAEESGAYRFAPYNRYHQFDSNGYPMWGTPDGIGLMQLEQDARLAGSGGQDFWAWTLNIADGIHWLYNQKQGPAYNSWNNEFQQMQADMSPGVRYPPDSQYTYCYFSYPQNNNDSYADGDWIHYYNGNYFIFWNHTNLSWDIDTTGYVSKVCNTQAL